MLSLPMWWSITLAEGVVFLLVNDEEGNAMVAILKVE
jgi:hypothetical protein